MNGDDFIKITEEIYSNAMSAGKLIAEGKEKEKALRFILAIMESAHWQQKEIVREMARRSEGEDEV
jgi:hypothetical protein